GTTHADSFHGPVPVTVELKDTEISENYEENTGHAIVRTFRDIDYSVIPAVLVANHAPFAWGPDPRTSAHNAVILEFVARMAYYFLLVLAIGFYLKRFAKTGEDFFLAGREMTAWVAGLAFVSANLGSLELLGWAGSAYQYGILAAHWYWIGAIPAMVFLGVVMMPF